VLGCKPPNKFICFAIQFHITAKGGN